MERRLKFVAPDVAIAIGVHVAISPYTGVALPVETDGCDFYHDLMECAQPLQPGEPVPYARMY